MTLSRQRTQAVLNVLRDKRINEFLTMRASFDRKHVIVELEPGLLVDKFRGEFTGEGEIATDDGRFRKLRVCHRGVIFIAYSKIVEAA